MTTQPEDHLESGRHLDFDVAEIETLESFPPQYVLRVAGVAPHADMTVELRPVPGPAGPYRRVEVVGFPRGAGRRRPGPYEVRLALPAPRSGQRGIEVVGATRRERFELAVPDVVEDVEGDVDGEVGDVVEEYDQSAENGWGELGERHVQPAEAGGRRPAPTTAIRGVVRDSSGWPLSGVRVTARPAAARPRPDDPGTRTDADGRYRLRHPGPGSVRVEATAEGFRPAAGETWVERGGTGRVDLHLSPRAPDGPDRGEWEVVEGSD